MESFVYKQGWTDERKLLLKLAEITAAARYIQKTGKNKFHGYTYVTEADANEKIGDELAKRKIVFIPNMLSTEMRETTTQKGNVEYICKANMEFTFMDAETGESITTKMSGEGQDNGDKALYKATSGTQKYILLKFFMLASGDDPEGDEEVDKRNAAKEQSHSSPQQSQHEPHREPAHSQTSTKPPISSKQIGLIKGRIEELVKLGGEREALYTSIKVKVGEFNELSDLNIEQASKVIELVNGWVAKKKAQQPKQPDPFSDGKELNIDPSELPF